MRQSELVDAERRNDGAVHLLLSKAEALVLFEWLHRVEDDGLGIIHKAERRVLWDVSALLERILVEPLDVDYHALIDQARAEVNDE
jgi:hypothetical protein